MLKELIRYTEVADKLVLKTFFEAGKSMPQAEALFSHVLNAQHIWVSRINGADPIHERFDAHPLSFFAEVHERNITQLKEILAVENLDRTISYTNSFGSFVDAVKHVLLHVANHSTYHRAQIASLFKQSGVLPPVTDFISLQREGSL